MPGRRAQRACPLGLSILQQVTRLGILLRIPLILQYFQIMPLRVQCPGLLTI